MTNFLLTRIIKILVKHKVKININSPKRQNVAKYININHLFQ